MSFDTAQPYIASYVVLRNGNKIAMVLRSNTGWMNNYWGLPSGKVEKKEPFIKAAIREAKEETGVDIKQENIRHVLTMHRQQKGDQIPEWVDIFFEASKWEGEPHNAEPEIHSELAWVDIDTLPDNTIPNVRYALEQIKQGNSYCELGWSN